MSASEKLIVALDVSNFDEARHVVDALPEVQWYKIGSQLFTSVGPRVVEMVKDAGKKVFLDLKFHDIPNTVVGSAVAAVNLGVDMFDLHILGGFEMMESTTKIVGVAAAEKHISRPVVLGVTILTSINEANLHDIFGYTGRSLDEEILMLAQLAKDAGLDGVVASSQEVQQIKKNVSPDFVVVTPGIRPRGWDDYEDQVRVNTPENAIRSGADFIVVGRPILRADKPREAAVEILQKIEDIEQGKDA